MTKLSGQIFRTTDIFLLNINIDLIQEQFSSAWTVWKGIKNDFHAISTIFQANFDEIISEENISKNYCNDEFDAIGFVTF